MPVDGVSLPQSTSADASAGDASGMPGAAAPAVRAPRLSVVLPTFNERDNLPVLIERLDATLAGAACRAPASRACLPLPPNSSP